jgi:hypothetical protein
MQYHFGRWEAASMAKRAAVYRKKGNEDARLVPRGAPPEVSIEVGDSVIDLATWADQLVQIMLRQIGSVSQPDQTGNFSDPEIDGAYPEAS